MWCKKQCRVCRSFRTMCFHRINQSMLSTRQVIFPKVIDLEYRPHLLPPSQRNYKPDMKMTGISHKFPSIHDNLEKNVGWRTGVPPIIWIKQSGFLLLSFDLRQDSQWSRIFVFFSVHLYNWKITQQPAENCCTWIEPFEKPGEIDPHALLEHFNNGGKWADRLISDVNKKGKWEGPVWLLQTIKISPVFQALCCAWLNCWRLYAIYKMCEIPLHSKLI